MPPGRGACAADWPNRWPVRCGVGALDASAMATSLSQRTLVTFVLDVSEPMGTFYGGRTPLDQCAAFTSLRVLEMVGSATYPDDAQTRHHQSMSHCLWFGAYVCWLTQAPTTSYGGMG